MPRPMSEPTTLPPAKQRYIWPWILVALVIVGMTLAVFAIRNEAHRVREQRQEQMPNPAQ
jgi:F0F1-type ATP synthase assembly protein I